MRKKDAHILSVDRVMFIADERFQAILGDGSETWTLQVKYVQARDEGDYECQISTEPKMSHLVHLNVVGEFNWYNERRNSCPLFRKSGQELVTTGSRRVVVKIQN